MQVSRIHGTLSLPLLFGTILIFENFAMPAPVRGESPQATAAAASKNKDAADFGATRRTRLFARGYLYEDDKPKAMGVVTIDPETGAWKKLLDESRSGFEVSPDGETITFTKDGALWNGDTATNANPGKIFAEPGRVVFSPDSKSMLVTTSKSTPDKPNDSETVVWRMRLDGSSAVPIAALTGWDVRDWSSDDWLLTVDKNRAVHVVRPDGKEPRQLLKAGEHPCFSPDGQQVMNLRQWMGTIRAIGIDGSNDRLIFQAPELTFAVMAR
jgi:hypothetical protein